MRSRIGALLVVLIAAVIALLVGPLASTFADVAPTAATNCAYDTHHAHAQFPQPASERGPPASYDCGATCDAVDRWSNGASPRSGWAAVPTTYTYDHTALLVQVACVAAATGRLGQATSILIPSLARSQVAAKSGPDLAQGFNSFRAAKRSLPSPGQGNVYDHVVEQSQIAANRSGFDPRLIHNPANLNPVSAAVNQAKANCYSSIRPFTGGQTVRNWLNGQSFEQQHSFGMDITGLIQRGATLP